MCCCSWSKWQCGTPEAPSHYAVCQEVIQEASGGSTVGCKAWYGRKLHSLLLVVKEQVESEEQMTPETVGGGVDVNGDSIASSPSTNGWQGFQEIMGKSLV